MSVISDARLIVGRTRLAALGAIRIVALGVGFVSAAAGIAYFVVSAAGPAVWWPSPTGGGSFIGLSLELRLINAGTFLLWNLTVAGLGFIVADLAWRVRRGVEFVPSVSRAAWALAIVLGVGTWFAQIAENIASWSGPRVPDTGDWRAMDLSELPTEWAIGPHTFIPNGAFLGLALILGVLAYIIQAGERLQRDTEGLV